MNENEKDNEPKKKSKAAKVAAEAELVDPDLVVYVAKDDNFMVCLPDGTIDPNLRLTLRGAINHVRARTPQAISMEGINKFFASQLYSAVLQTGYFLGEYGIINTNQGRVFNLLAPPDTLPAPEPAPTPRIDALLKYLTAGDDAGLDWLLNWCAAKVQNPLRPLPTAVSFLGHSGTGKSTFVRVMMEMIGLKNCVSIGQDLLDSRFTSAWAGRCLVNVDEAVSSENAVATGYKAKRYITSGTIEYHAKGKDPVDIKNTTAWIFTTNGLLALREDEDDRRFTSFVQPKEPTPEHKAMLQGCFEGTTPTQSFREEIAAFARRLLDFEVNERTLTIPYYNSAKKDLAALSRNSAEDFWAELTEIGLDLMEHELLPDGPYDDAVSVPKAPARVMADRVLRDVSRPGLYKLYRRFAEMSGQRAVSKNKFFVLAKQKYQITEAPRIDNKRFVTVWWKAGDGTVMQSPKGVQ